MINLLNKAFFFLFLVYSVQSKGLEFNTDDLLIIKGKKTELASNEGYLLLSLDNADKIDNLIIRSKKLGNSMKFHNIEAGENIALIKLKEGEYFWETFMFYFKKGSLRFSYKKDEFSFKVEAGKINYPGTWVTNIRFTKYSTAYQSLSTQNKSAHQLNKLRGSFNKILNKYPFEFKGKYPDTYPVYYGDIAKNVNVAHDKNYTSFKKDSGIASETKDYPKITGYLNNNDQSVGNFNPNGRYLIFKILEDGLSKIRVLNLLTYQMDTLFSKELTDNAYINNVEWIDNDSIYYSVYIGGDYEKRVVHLKIDKNYNLVGAEQIKIPTYGALINPLTKEGNLVYIAKNSIYSSRKTGLYKIDLSSEKTIRKTSKKPFEVVKKLKDSVYWLSDHSGKIRFIITSHDVKNEDYVILKYWFKSKKGKWENIHTINSDETPEAPGMISKDNNYLYVLTNKFGDKKSIHKYSTKDYQHEGVFYENKNIEITNVKIDNLSGEIIGVYHVVNGFNRIEYFETEKDDLQVLRKQYPDHKFNNAQNNKEINKILVYGTNEYSKGSWSLYDTSTDTINKLFEVDPKYSSLEKGVFHNIKIQSKDNIEIEGYLVIPKNILKKKAPLIVMPHGGPIGVRDYAYNSDVQHFYASQGYATLKVNYRGSGGFGKKFLESGKKQWGEKIESDINEVVDYVTKNHHISEDNICAMGSSYGGYSSIMLTVLYPERYKCAVSLAGVMDIPLMFTSSDFRNSEKSLEKFTKIVGDPIENNEYLINKSPLYLADKITKPILLFHGAKDKRVTIEHSIRMKEVLDLQRKNSEFIVLEDEGHSFIHLESRIHYIVKSLDFIKKHIK